MFCSLELGTNCVEETLENGILGVSHSIHTLRDVSNAHTKFENNRGINETYSKL